MRESAGKPSPPALLQFGLRALLAAMGVSAVACAAAAPFVRELTADQQRRLLMSLGAFASGAGILVATTFFLRRNVVRRSGATLLSAPLVTIGSLRSMLINTFVQVGFNLWISSRIVMSDGPWWAPWIGLTLCLLNGFQLTLMLLFLSSRRRMVSLVLCENGLVLNSLRFRPWGELAGGRWDFERGYVWFAKRTYYANGYTLPPELREEANRIMREHVAPVAEETTHSRA